MPESNAAMGEGNVARAAGWVVGCFGLSTLAAIGLGVNWWRHGSTQVSGLLLSVSLALLSAGLAVWANRLVPQGPFVEPRPVLADPEEDRAAASELAEGTRFPRRTLVATSLVGAATVLGGVLVIPFSSLGARPGDELLRTAWRRGRRAVDEAGAPVRASEIPVGGVVTVFPEGDAGSADGQVVLIRVTPDLLELPGDRMSWAVDGLIGYSKVCTHAGCPVGLYSADRHELLCPCHQSAFDVLRGAVPTAGPAAWPLPQLPLRVGDRSEVLADGPLSEPVGPGWWKT